MPITQQQKDAAEAQQKRAAHEQAVAVRLLAGPGTGKSRTIAERVHWLIADGVSSSDICVISFTRATARDLQSRVVRHCTAEGTGPEFRPCTHWLFQLFAERTYSQCSRRAQ